MNRKTKETVLRFLVDYYVQHRREYFKDFSQLCEFFPGIQPHILEATLRILKEEKLVNFIWADDMPFGITLTPAGLAYFDRQEQAKQETWSERKWDLVQLSIGFVGGFLTGIFTTWVTVHFIK